MASYVLLQLEHPGRSLEEADQVLRTVVRENDVWGISESGELYLMLVQTDNVSLPVVLKRLNQAGFYGRQINAENTELQEAEEENKECRQ